MLNIILIILIIISIFLIIVKIFHESKDTSYDVYVITIPRLKERQKIISEHLKSKGIEFKFHYGVDGKDLNQETIDKYANSDKLSRSQLGIFLSHYTLWEKIKNKSTPTLILEDDAIINDDINKVTIPKDYDVIYFGHCYETKSDKQINEFLFESNFPRAAHGMLLSKNGVRKMLEFFKNRKVNIDFDVIYSYHLIKKEKILKAYSVFPTMIVQNPKIHSESERFFPSHEFFDQKN